MTRVVDEMTSFVDEMTSPVRRTAVLGRQKRECSSFDPHCRAFAVPLPGVSAMIACPQLPNRHYAHMQPDQFTLDLPLDSPLMGKAKNDRNLMVYAWFV